MKFFIITTASSQERLLHILKRGQKIDWSKRDKDLFQLIVGGVKTKVCDHCNQSDHQAPFCPSQFNVQNPISIGKRQNDLVRGKYPDSKFDKRGRSRVLYIKEKRFAIILIVILADLHQQLAPLPMYVKNANQNSMVNQSVIPRNHPVICK